MVAVESTMLPLGTKAPEFSLPDSAGVEVSLEALAAGRDALVVAFICNHCPYVKLIADRFAELGNQWQQNGVGVVAINSNDADAHPDDSPAAMAGEVKLRGYEFPYLFDESQQVARAYKAACTPDFFLFDKESHLAYRGRLDASSPKNGLPNTGDDLRTALEAVACGLPAPEPWPPALGCSIKWKA
jgi:peroxiredoxin